MHEQSQSKIKDWLFLLQQNQNENWRQLIKSKKKLLMYNLRKSNWATIVTKNYLIGIIVDFDHVHNVCQTRFNGNIIISVLLILFLDLPCVKEMKDEMLLTGHTIIIVANIFCIYIVFINIVISCVYIHFHII